MRRRLAHHVGVAVEDADGALPVLYRDDHVVAVHKPAGLLVHRSVLAAREARSAVALLRAQLGHRVHPVHRLDRGASGVLLFALTREGASALGESVRRRRVSRRYVAVVRGWPVEAGMIDYPLRRVVDPAEQRPPTRSRVGAPRLERLAAITHYRRLATVELPERVDRYPTSRYSLLALLPETGRRHQIRRHLDHLSHPIIGDSTYGKGRHNRFVAERFGVARLLLACVEVRFPHPATGETLVVVASLAPDISRVVEALGWTTALPRQWNGI